MHTLNTHDLIVNGLAVVMMPLIIWANLRGAGMKSSVHDYLWREHANLMRVTLVILALVTLFAACALLADFGLISPAQAETTAMVIAIPFMVAAVAMIALAGMSALKLLRDWCGRGKGA